MCIGRDARINNSRVISRIIIRYFELLSARLHPSVANEEAKAFEFTLGVRYRANTVTSRMWGEDYRRQTKAKTPIRYVHSCVL